MAGTALALWWGWERAQAVSLGLLGALGGGGVALVNPVRAWVSQLPASFEAAGRKLAPSRQSLEQISQVTCALGQLSCGEA